MEQKDLCLIIPAYNEEKNLPKLIAELKAAQYSNDQIIIVNDCSGDDTLEIANTSGALVIDLPINLGIGGAMQSGYMLAASKGFRYVCQIDGDGQHPPEEIETLYKKISKTKADMVFGSRFIDQSLTGFKSASVTRSIGIVITRLFIQMACRKKFYDITSGFRMIDINL